MNKKNLALALVTSIGLTSAALASVAAAEGPHHKRGHFFEKIDANKDGKVTLDEAKAAEKARFASIDTNKDGRLTTAELEAHHASKRAEHAKAKPERMKKHGAKFFAKLDANGDGVIDAAESAAKVEKMFARMDENGDGVVTKDELGRRGGECGHKGGKRDKGAGSGAAGSGPAE